MTPEDRSAILEQIDALSVLDEDEQPRRPVSSLIINVDRAKAGERGRAIETEATHSATRAREAVFMRDWRGMITQEMLKHGDSWDNLDASTINDAQLDNIDGITIDEDEDLHRLPSTRFTLWTASRVYFPVHRGEYDGGPILGSVPRHPTYEATCINPDE